MTIGVWSAGTAKAVAFFLNNSEFTTARSLNLKKTRFFSIWVDRLGASHFRKKHFFDSAVENTTNAKPRCTRSTSREAETWLQPPRASDRAMFSF
jgi:hypothetical protein